MLVHMHAVRNLTEVSDLLPVACDLAELLTRSDNVDIAREFPASVDRYTGDVEAVAYNLEAARDGCEPGVRQQFIAFAGDRAVGMSVVRLIDKVPDVIETGWPNLSGFVCNPFRNRGIGRLSLLERLRVVDEQFGGNAWTKVKKTNPFSNIMVSHAGLELVGVDDVYNIYSYRKERH